MILTIIYMWRQFVYTVRLKEWCIKEDRIKHILPKFFFTNNLQRYNDINIQQVCSGENLSYLIQSLCKGELFSNQYMRLNFIILKIIAYMRGRNKYVLQSFFSLSWFCPIGFSQQVFNEAGDNVLKDDVLFFLH